MPAARAHLGLPRNWEFRAPQSMRACPHDAQGGSWFPRWETNRHQGRCGARRISIMDAIGRLRWAIAEGYIPSGSSYQERELLSHETACILNAGDKDAKIAV